MTAVVGQGDLAALRRFASAWRAVSPWRMAVSGHAAFRDLEAMLDQVRARRAKGGDELAAGVRGDSIPELHAAALLKAAELWGPEAELTVEETGTVFTDHRPGGRFHASVTVRCLNYAEVSK